MNLNPTPTPAQIADLLDQVPRIGAALDIPEGSRYIQLSDTLARDLATALRYPPIRPRPRAVGGGK